MAQEKESQLRKQSSEYEEGSDIEISSGVRTARTPQRNHNWKRWESTKHQGVWVMVQK
jgi:hypothetical protein